MIGNLKFFKKLLSELAEKETDSLKLIKKKNDRERKNPNKPRDNNYDELSDYEKALSNYLHMSYVSSTNPFHGKYNQLFYKVDPYKDNWIDEYYKLHFGFNTNGDMTSRIDEVCHNYMESILFNLKYYVSGVPPSWQWFYKYNVPPTMTDFNRYIQKQTSLSFVKFVKGKPFKPFEQLMLILPPVAAKAILPKSLSSSITGPLTFDLNATYGQKNIYSEPILPIIDADKMVSIVAAAKLTGVEKKRNVKGKVKTVKAIGNDKSKSTSPVKKE